MTKAARILPTCGSCDQPAIRRGLFCKRHYCVELRAGRIERLPKLTIDERFWAKVDRTAECWTWTAYCGKEGYGRFSIDSVPVRTHRWIWERLNGPIPEGMFICHHCDNPPCVRPDHLFLGTPMDNVLDKMRKGRLVNGAMRQRARRDALRDAS